MYIEYHVEQKKNKLSTEGREAMMAVTESNSCDRNVTALHFKPSKLPSISVSVAQDTPLLALVDSVTSSSFAGYGRIVLLTNGLAESGIPCP